MHQAYRTYVLSTYPIFMIAILNTPNESLILYLTLFGESVMNYVKLKMWEASLRLKLSHKQIIKQMIGTN